MSNTSIVTTFFLSGLPHPPVLDSMLFGIFLVIYILTVLGNLLILTVIRVDSHLHTPMYYFLTNLSFLDMCYTTSIVPQMLTDLVPPTKTISFMGCVAQLYLFHTIGGTEGILLVLMSSARLLCGHLRISVLHLVEGQLWSSSSFLMITEHQWRQDLVM